TDTAGDYLPTSYGRNGFAATSSNGYLYVLGGVNGGANKNEVLYTRVNPDASLGDPNSCGVNSSVWCTTTTFTTARKDASAFAYNGIVYLVGGYDGSNALADTQYAAVNTTTGALGTWAYTMREDRAMRNKQVVAGNGYAYFIGNETTNTDIEYMPINLNNTLGNMNKTTTLPSVHTNGGAVFQNGYLYIFGGCTAFSSGNCTTVSNVVERVGQRANARVGHYSKLFDTQVDTAPSQFLLNGSGNFVASIQTASTTDPVLGTAQNINPAVAGAYYLIFALDSTGTNVGIAFNYYTFLALDDSNNGTFPDSVSSNVTDFTIFYHSNPSRRLRHGASFTNSSCNSTPANGCILDTAP
ncbi:MAG TPA: hypothetical protein VLF67_05330, partial [Candidatus Saccharimonas sp.]|nr:hypothetical protein [Candidatus Saccharimonas sp.]